jgi:hypothetical protein
MSAFRSGSGSTYFRKRRRANFAYLFLSMRKFDRAILGNGRLPLAALLDRMLDRSIPV